jgi:hypothetical protein
LPEAGGSGGDGLVLIEERRDLREDVPIGVASDHRVEVRVPAQDFSTVPVWPIPLAEEAQCAP